MQLHFFRSLNNFKVKSYLKKYFCLQLSMHSYFLHKTIKNLLFAETTDKIKV